MGDKGNTTGAHLETRSAHWGCPWHLHALLYFPTHCLKCAVHGSGSAIRQRRIRDGCHRAAYSGMCSMKEASCYISCLPHARTQHGTRSPDITDISCRHPRSISSRSGAGRILGVCADSVLPSHHCVFALLPRHDRQATKAAKHFLERVGTSPGFLGKYKNTVRGVAISGAYKEENVRSCWGPAWPSYCAGVCGSVRQSPWPVHPLGTGRRA